jgi:hypothetical protein
MTGPPCRPTDPKPNPNPTAMIEAEILKLTTEQAPLLAAAILVWIAGMVLASHLMNR